MTVLFLLSSSATIFAQRAEISVKCDSDPDSINGVIKNADANLKDKKVKVKKSEDKSLRLKLNIKNTKSAETRNLTGEAGIIPKGCTAVAQVLVQVGPPNTIVSLTFSQSNPANILTMSLTQNGTFGTTVVVPVQLNGNGQGVANFYVRGVVLGETTISGIGQETYTNPLDLIVVECKCPVIPVNTPPRN